MHAALLLALAGSAQAGDAFAPSTHCQADLTPVITDLDILLAEFAGVHLPPSTVASPLPAHLEEAVGFLGFLYDTWALNPMEGGLTFDAEGQERRGRYFSRVAHVPGPWSGVTIGRGYDLKYRKADEVVNDRR